MLEPKRGPHASPQRQHWATSRQFSDVSCLVFNYFGCFKKKLVRGKWNRFANFCIPKNFGAHAYARRTAPNKQASTFIFLYKLLFFFFFYRSTRDVHLFVAVPTRVYNSTSPKTSITDPLTALPSRQASFAAPTDAGGYHSGKTTTARSTACLEPPHLLLKALALPL